MAATERERAAAQLERRMHRSHRFLLRMSMFLGLVAALVIVLARGGNGPDTSVPASTTARTTTIAPPSTEGDFSDQAGSVEFTLPLQSSGAPSAGQAYLGKRNDDRPGSESQVRWSGTRQVTCEVASVTGSGQWRKTNPAHSWAAPASAGAPRSWGHVLFFSPGRA